MSKQFVIVDGYNLLHLAGFIPSRNIGPGTLERARNQLLGILARHLSIEQRKRTTVVFDSSEPDLPNRFTVNEILVEFANAYDNADDLIAMLIRKHSAPSQLMVVSSDHQVQKAALARKSETSDADLWLDQLIDSPPNGKSPATKRASHPKSEHVLHDATDVEYWKSVLEIDDEMDLLAEPVKSTGRMKKPPKSKRESTSNKNPDQPVEKVDAADPKDDLQEKLTDTGDIFPPGYADDLFDE